MFNPTVDSVIFLLIQWNPSRADTITAKKTVRFSMIMYKIGYKFLLVSYTHSTTWTFIRTSPSPTRRLSCYRQISVSYTGMTTTSFTFWPFRIFILTRLWTTSSIAAFVFGINSNNLHRTVLICIWLDFVFVCHCIHT